MRLGIKHGQFSTGTRKVHLERLCLREARNGEELVYLPVYVHEIQSCVVTNFYDFYSLTLARGTYNITFSFIGLKYVEKDVFLNKSLKLNIDLKEDCTRILLNSGER